MNNQMNFDPMTGQPINQGADATTQVQGTQPEGQTTVIENITVNTQQQMQNIPTVDQSKQEFISNTQNITEQKKENKSEKANWTFIIILFIVILAAVFFLFPILFRYI